MRRRSIRTNPLLDTHNAKSYHKTSKEHCNHTSIQLPTNERTACRSLVSIFILFSALSNNVIFPALINTFGHFLSLDCDRAFPFFPGERPLPRLGDAPDVFALESLFPVSVSLATVASASERARSGFFLQMA